MPEKGWDIVNENLKKESPLIFFKRGESRILRAVGPMSELSVIWADVPNTQFHPRGPLKRKYIVPDRFLNIVQEFPLIKNEAYQITKRYAICVFDPKDFERGDKKIYIFESGNSFFVYADNYFEKVGKQIGSNSGPLFKVKKDIFNGIESFETLKEKSNFTDEMLSFITRTNKEQYETRCLNRRGLIDIEKYYDTNSNLESLNTFFNVDLNQILRQKIEQEEIEKRQGNDLAYIDFVEL